MIPSPSHVHLQVDDTYLPEVWTWFAIGVITIALRAAVRLRTVGLGGLGGDDFCIMISLILWTLDGVIVQITYYTGGSIDVTPDVLPTLSNTDIDILVYGTKWEYASFYTYSGLIWSLKFSVLFFYRRLKADDWRQTWLTVNRLFFINGLAYLALCLTAIFSCWPFHLNWAVQPLPPLRCSFRPQNFWTLVVLNVLTDVAILCVPVPILWQIRVSRLRRLGVSLLLCSGLFLISTAIIRAAFTISGTPSIITINRWGFRETAVGLMAVNAPVLAPMFSKAFWKKGAYRPSWQDQNVRPNRTALLVANWRRRSRNQFSKFQIPSALQWSKSQSSKGTAGASSEATELTKKSTTGVSSDVRGPVENVTAQVTDIEAGVDSAPGESSGRESLRISPV